MNTYNKNNMIGDLYIFTNEDSNYDVIVQNNNFIINIIFTFAYNTF